MLLACIGFRAPVAQFDYRIYDSESVGAPAVRFNFYWVNYISDDCISYHIASLKLRESFLTFFLQSHCFSEALRN